MPRLSQQPIRRQVIAVAVALVVSVVSVVAWAARRTILERHEEIGEYAGSMAATLAQYLNQYLVGLDTLAAALVSHPAVKGLQTAESDRLFADLLRDRPLILNIVLTGADGSNRGSGVKAAPDQRESAAPWPYAGEVLARGKPVVSDLSVGTLTRKPTIVLGYPVKDDSGATVGVLGVGINLARLQTVLTSIPLPDKAVVTMTNRRGVVLARSREPERFIGTRFEQAVAPKDAPRSVSRIGLDGVERIWGNAPVDRGDWLLSVGIPASAATARLQPLWLRSYGIVALVAGASFLALFWLVHQISRHLNSMRTAVQRIADGDFTPPSANAAPSLELAELQQGVATMAANLQTTRDALDRQVDEERKMRETLQLLQRQVVRQERLAAVGLLASGVAHELNNPLQAILGTTELLERNRGLGPEVLDEVAFVKTQSQRAREIIRNLSRFSSQQSGPPTLVDLRDVISEVVQLRGRDLDASGIKLDVDLGSGVRRVLANFTELEQVTLNFVINAQQSIVGAGLQKGRILIRLRDERLAVRVEVVDNGPGVDPEDEHKLFQPFFTTKPVGKGTGLGLSVSYGIIDSYGGTIGYRRNEWGGATFYFELPARDPLGGGSPDHDRSPVLHRSILPGV